MKYTGIKKLYYSISEISEMLDIKQSVIRYWESEFKDLKPQKNRAGNRIYKKEDIALIRLIHYYVHGKHLSIQEAAEMIRSLREEGLYERKLTEITPPEEDKAETFSREEEEEAEENLPEAEEAETVQAEITEEESETISGSPKNEAEPRHQPETPAETEAPLQAEEHRDKLPFPAETESAGPETATPAEEHTPQTSQDDNVRDEMRELLHKISANICDIIAILKESRN
ncbi:MAG: MerR family transcriptional regulator [Candidatus Marinimicrobia bacterium]|jgi:DNA-binding transcriptional MerR regulator|nr:MerR family transcriptional regulator [Candidatus Neomarinimicrobiota bacterium]MDD5709050.1 MerR family transcriptional regulator [Candidatus Neomarinimicrobiota bacterium]MDX9777593.1 MerR family transcriptional regulator [bacterium]